MILDEGVTIGGVRREGGDITSCCPTLLGDERVVLGCGAELRVVDVGSSREVALLRRHDARVVGTAADGDTLLSCDEEGGVAVGTLGEWRKLAPFPIPSSAAVEHIAFVGWQSRTLALVVNMNRGVGPRCVLLQNDYNKYQEKCKILASDVLEGSSVACYNSAGAYSAVVTVVKAGSFALNVLPMRCGGERRPNRRVLLGARTPTCVAAHPRSDTVAVGDTHGGVQIYYQVLASDQPASMRLHWHHTPLAHAAFSGTGMELYTGGEEAALVQWQVAGATARQRQILPHLGQPICWVAEGGGSVLAGHTDNSYSVVSAASMQTSNLILGLGTTLPKPDHSQINRPHHDQTTEPDQSQARPLMLFDPRSRALVTNARPGHLLFYHVATRSQLAHVDVLHENHVPGAAVRHVRHACLSADGGTLVTVDGTTEATADGTAEGAADSRLRFWDFQGTTQSWALTCSVLRPHSSPPRGCAVRPSGGSAPSAVLTWTTEELKLWHPCRGLDGAQQYQSHCTRAIGGFAVEACVGVAWWHDGSMVAVGSGRTVTVYDVSADVTRLTKRVSRRLPVSAVCQLVSTPHRLLALSPCGLLTSLPLTPPLAPLTLPLQASSLHTSPHLPNRVVVATKTAKIVVLDAVSGAALGSAQLSSPALALALCLHPRADPLDAVRLYATLEDRSVVSVDVGFSALGAAAMRLAEATQSPAAREASERAPPSPSPLHPAPSLQCEHFGSVVNKFYSSHPHDEVQHFGNWLTNMDIFARETIYAED